MALHRTGRSVLNTTICSWAMPTIRSRSSIAIHAAFLNNRISQDVDMVTLRINYRFGGYGAPISGPSTDLSGELEPRHRAGAFPRIDFRETT